VAARGELRPQRGDLQVYRIISDGDGSAYREFGDATRGKRRRVARLS